MPFLPFLPWIIGGAGGFFAGNATAGGFKWLFWLALLAITFFVLQAVGVL